MTEALHITGAAAGFVDEAGEYSWARRRALGEGGTKVTLHTRDVALAGQPAKVLRVVDNDQFAEIIRRFGQNLLLRLPNGAVHALSEYLTVHDVRRIAYQIQQQPDPDIPERPRRCADALLRFADAAQAAPPSLDDVCRVPDWEKRLIARWADLAEETSRLLEPVCELLYQLARDRSPRVRVVRDLMQLLDDASKLLPGLDASLHRVLLPYVAGLPS